MWVWGLILHKSSNVATIKLQEYLQGSLSTLMSTYALNDKSGVCGQVILQLGCIESNLLRAGLNQLSTDMSNLPPSSGTILYQLLTDPDSVILDHLTLESFIVSSNLFLSQRIYL